MSTNFVPLEKLADIKRDASVLMPQPRQQLQPPYQPPYQPHLQYPPHPSQYEETPPVLDDSQYAHEPYTEPIKYVNPPVYSNESAYLKQPLYDRLQLPMLIAIIYYILQLPFIKQIIIMLGMDSICYTETGEITTEGHLIKSICMGGLFYVIHTSLIK